MTSSDRWTSACGETSNPWTGMLGYFMATKGPTGFGSGSTAEEVAASYEGKGKVVLITGASAGLGQEAARVLAGRGCQILMAVRDPARGKAAADKIRAAQPSAQVEVMQVDLSSRASIRAFAQELLKSSRPLHTIMCNAGVMAVPTFTPSVDGHELQFATNHLGHFLLVYLLLPRLLETARREKSEGRVVVLSSAAHFLSYAEGIGLGQVDNATGYSPMLAYGQSKLANLLFARQLAQALQGEPVAVVACHPGGILTELSRHIRMPWPVLALSKLCVRPFMKSVAQGAATQVYLATAPSVLSGEYYADCNLSPSHPHAHDRQLAQRLWQLSEEMVTAKG